MRWMLLMAQLRGAKGENVQLINNLYNNFFMQELMKARFLVPMKLPDQPENEKTDNKQFAIKKDTQMALAVRQGNNKKPALMLYTDWGKFNVLYRGWGGLIMKLQDAIRTNDVIIDGTDHPQLAFFIGQDAFAKMQEAIKNIRTQKVSREELAKQIKAEAGENNTGKTDDEAESDEAGSGIPS